MLLKVTEVEYGEKEVTNGKKFSGYYLRGLNDDNKEEFFIADLAIKNIPQLAIVKSLQKNDVVDIIYTLDKVSNIYLMYTVHSKPTYTNTTQNSIERQNALTNATNLVGILFKSDKDNYLRQLDKENINITDHVKIVAKDLLNFHKEMINEK